MPQWLSMSLHFRVEVMPKVQVHGASVNLLIVIFYCPESSPVNSIFFYKFADVIEPLAILSAPIIIVGDVNIHPDDALAASTSLLEHS